MTKPSLISCIVCVLGAAASLVFAILQMSLVYAVIAIVFAIMGNDYYQQYKIFRDGK